MDLNEYTTELIINEQKKKEEKINRYVYKFIKTHYTWYDIQMAFATFNTFEKFIDDVREKILQDEEWYTL